MARARRSASDPRAAVDLVRQLGAALAEFGLAEVEVSLGELRVRLQRSIPAAPAGPITVPAPTPPVGAERPVVS